MTFPTSRLGIIVEAALGSTANMNPTTWPWTDLSSRLLAQGIAISRGQENESQGIQPATATIELDNLDGALTPNNAMSAYWPYIRRGTPMRITTEGGRKGAWLPGGVGNYWSSAHRSADNISGDIDIRVRVDPDRWFDPRPSDFSQYLVAIWGSGASTCQWAFGLTDWGSSWFQWSTDGSSFAGQAISNNSLASLRPLWVGFTFDANNGSGGYTWRLYRSDADSPPADITTWTLVETQSYAGLGPVTMATGASSSLKVGARDTTYPGMRGTVFAAQVRNGINGTVVANADFTAPNEGTTSFNDSTGRTWSRNGSAAISTYKTRFAGTIDSVVLDWPYGAHNAAVQNTHPSECRVVITVSDVVRRLGQGNKPLQSSLRRFLTAQDAYPTTAYWPCEDGPATTQLGSGNPGGSPIAISGATSTDNSLPSAGPLPVLPSDAASSWVGAVPWVDTDAWTVNFVFRAPEWPASGRMSLINVRTVNFTGVEVWQLALAHGHAYIFGWDPGGTAIVQIDVSPPFPDEFWGPWILVHFDLRQDGVNVDWQLTFTRLDVGGAEFYGGTQGPLTLGQVSIVSNSLLPAEAPQGLAFGHVVVTDGSRANGWMAGADTAWVGESAAHRIWRLAAEEGLQAEIVGDPELDSLRGNIARSQPMGPQAQDSLLNLLDACAAVDRGILTSRPTHPGFIYRTRATLDNQSVRLALDASTNAVSLPLQPTLDDQRIRNDVTVSMAAGTNARLTDSTSIAAEGLYATEVEVDGIGGVVVQSDIVMGMPGLDLAIAHQAEWLANWLLQLGIQTDLRYPKLLVDLSLVPSLMTAWSELALGDRIQLTGLPNQHPTEAVELIVEAMEDLMSPTAWIGGLVGSPGALYATGVLDA